VASNNRKKTFPKKPERLNSVSAKLLGKNSNKVCREATIKGIYKANPTIKDSLSPEQRRQLDALKLNLSSRYQKD
jgi:hypothetical protein